LTDLVWSSVADMLDGGALEQSFYCDRFDCDGMPHEGFYWRHARAKQRPPEGNWYLWNLRCGRGFGKTRTGAEWLCDRMHRFPGSRWAMCTPTYSDGRDIMVEGESGLRNVCDWHKIRYTWNRSLGEFIMRNGSLAQIFTAEDPDSWRGPNLAGAWCDEPATWNAPTACWNNLIFMVRLEPTEIVATGTPQNTPFVKKLRDECDYETTGGSDENRANLAEAWYAKVIEPLKGTRLGRQEIDAEILEDVAGALWVPGQIEACRRPVPKLSRTYVGVDPSVTSNEDSDECGVMGWGLDHFNHGYVLGDYSEVMHVDQWSRLAVDLHHELDGDGIIAEVNNGGDLVESVIHAIDRRIPVYKTRASKGKFARAEPVAALYGSRDRPDTWASGRIHHGAGVDLKVLESQQCEYVRGAAWSPDRLDALVWAATETMLDGDGRKPRRRGRMSP
jgi:phage terminase large subunit-like protein